MTVYRHTDLSGERFGRLLVIKYAGRSGSRVALWRCRCDCGTEKTIRAASLRHSRTLSCGCLNRERVRQTHTKHGAYKSATYKIWSAMLGRCCNPKNKVFAHYGGRGIAVCERWRNFEAFLEDMGERPRGYSLDRQNNQGNYEPSNCRWATRTEQSNNTRRNVRLEIDGVARTITEWADLRGLPRSTVRMRIARGWPAVRAVLGRR